MGRKTGTKAPEVRSLQPSKEAFKENVKRAALETESLALDPAEYG
jgi:hypothetical protein